MPKSPSEKPRVLFVESVHDILSSRLQDAGFSCENGFTLSRQEIQEVLHQYTGLVVRGRIIIDESLLTFAPALRFIARSGSGLENIDLEATARRNIQVFNSPEGNRDAVGEHAIAMLLSLFNKLKQADLEVRSGLWRREENRGTELAGKVVGIIGYGQMGSSFGNKLRGFGCEVIAYDKYLHNFSDAIARECTMEEIWERADVVSLHLPLTDETSYLANEAFFARFSKPIWFINTARGKNVDTAALVNAMRQERVLGACLDVLEYEKSTLEGLEISTAPEPLQYLLSSDRVILSPHIAGWTVESYIKLSSVLADKILGWWRHSEGVA